MVCDVMLVCLEVRSVILIKELARGADRKVSLLSDFDKIVDYDFVCANAVYFSLVRNIGKFIKTIDTMVNTEGKKVPHT